MFWPALALALHDTAFARPVSPESPESRLSSALAELSRLALAAAGPAGGIPELTPGIDATPSAEQRALADFCSTHPTLANAEAVQVVVEFQPVESPSLPPANLFDPATLPNAKVELQLGNSGQLLLPARDLLVLAALPGVLRVREPWRPSPKSDAVIGRGYDEVMVTDWHDEGVTGLGVRVGIVDVGFLEFETLLGKELPDSVAEFFDNGAVESSRHGAAVAEVVHDFAPDAELVLASFGTDLEFGLSLQTMLDEDVHIVNTSIGFDNVWHADGTSPVTKYADAVADAGVLFVGAAGNENERYRVGPLQYEPESEYIKLADKYAPLIKSPGGQARVSFRWSEPFGKAAADLDLVLLNPSDDSECGRSENPQDGDDYPYEEVLVTGCEEQVYAIVFSSTKADISGMTGYLYSNYGLLEGEATGTESLTLPADCFVCLAVGAYDETLGAAAYSSRGPSNDGRVKPDLVAPTDVATISMPSFSGSSAAAPHVTGLMALYLDRTLAFGDPEAAIQWARTDARDLLATGPDNATGSGLATGNVLPPEGCGCSSPPTSSADAISILAAAALALWHRARSYSAVIPVVGGLGCVPDGMDGQFVTLQGSVVTDVGLPVENAIVELSLTDGTLVGEASSNESGEWSFAILATEVLLNRIEARVVADGYAEGFGGWDINLLTDERTRLKAGPVTEWESVPRALAPLRIALAGEFARFSGKLADPYGTPAAGVELVVQQGWDASVGAAVATTASTDAEGRFSVSVDVPGLYTVYAAPQDPYGGTRFPAMATATGTEAFATISAPQAPGQLFATLTWTPGLDLDLHLTAPDRKEDGQGDEDRFHVWANDPLHPDRTVDGEPYIAEFVLASSNGPGPESLRINSAPGAGLVHLSVFDMSNRATVDSVEMAESQVLLQWWNGEDIPRYAWVSPLSAGTLWMPAKVDPRGGSTFAIEQYLDEVDPSDETMF